MAVAPELGWVNAAVDEYDDIKSVRRGGCPIADARR
jgi:hypothetical protein